MEKPEKKNSEYGCGVCVCVCVGGGGVTMVTETDPHCRSWRGVGVAWPCLYWRTSGNCPTLTSRGNSPAASGSASNTASSCLHHCH